MTTQEFLWDLVRWFIILTVTFTILGWAVYLGHLLILWAAVEAGGNGRL